MAEQLDQPKNPPLNIQRLLYLLKDWGINPAPAEGGRPVPRISAAYADLDARLARLRVELRRALRRKYERDIAGFRIRQNSPRCASDWKGRILSVMDRKKWYSVRDVRDRVEIAFGEPTHWARVASQITRLRQQGKVERKRAPGVVLNPRAIAEHVQADGWVYRRVA